MRIQQPRIRTLFAKIFLWYWAAMAAVGLVALLVTLATQPDTGEAARRSRVAAALDFYRATAASEYEDAGAEALQAYLDHLRRTGGMESWFFSAEGSELSGTSVPHEVTRFKEDVLESKASPNRLVWGAGSGMTLGCTRTRGPSGANYWLVVALPHSAEPGRLAWLMQGLRAPLSTHLLRWLTLFSASGLVCFGLARYLSAPLMQLSAAVHRFSAGELGARVGPKLGSREDEIATLGRDFDRMAERIEVLVQSQHRLLGDISHELRSPLTRLGVANDLAQHHLTNGNSAGAGEALQRIGMETARLDSLIDQLLTLVRLETGETLAKKSAVDLSLLVESVVVDAAYEARSRQRDVRLTASEPCTVLGHEELLRSAVENVVRNAVHYTAPETTVEVSLRTAPAGEGREVSIAVEDFGPGVPAEELELLFLPFYRVMTPGVSQSRGTGLGLAIASRAIKAHSGHCLAENKVTGGLIVRLQLPQ